MLLTVEGGGFFSSAASGYSKGFTFLLLGQGTEERSMRVSPWNQYQLVDREPEPNFQLASRSKRIPGRRASFICFGRRSAGVDGPSPPKVGPIHQLDGLHDPSDVAMDKDAENVKKVGFKSNLKRPSNPLVLASGGGTLETERKKVQWTDACGGELVEIREFEASSNCGSEEDLEDERGQSCRCVIQ